MTGTSPTRPTGRGRYPLHNSRYDSVLSYVHGVANRVATLLEVTSKKDSPLPVDKQKFSAPPGPIDRHMGVGCAPAEAIYEIFATFENPTPFLTGHH
jgi:hypothetical protein